MTATPDALRDTPPRERPSAAAVPGPRPTPDDATAAVAGSVQRALPSWPARLVGYARRRPARTVSLLFAVLIAACALVPSAIAPYGLHDGDVVEALRPPSLAHPFGTDQLGRDLLTQIVYGARPSLQASLLATLLGLIVGMALGLVAGYFGGVPDSLLMRLIDVLMAVPTMLLVLMVIAVLGAGPVNIAVAVAVATVPTFARVMRAEVLRTRGREYVDAALTSGVRRPAVLVSHVLPHAVGPVLSYAALVAGESLLATSGLSFLGFGAPPPNPEWGALAADGRSYLGVAWWLTTFPGLMVVATVLAATAFARTDGGPRFARAG